MRERMRALRLSLRMGGQDVDDVLAYLGRRTSITLLDAAELWARNVRASTQGQIRSMIGHGILRDLAPLDLEQLDGDRLDRWVADADRSYAASSILHASRVLAAIVRYAIAKRKLRHTPWGEWHPPRRLDATPRAREIAKTPQDARCLLAAAMEMDAESTRSPCLALEPKIALALLSGLRSGELSGLRWSDIDVVTRRITIRTQKGNQRVKTYPDTLRASDELLEILHRYRQRLVDAGHCRDDGPVFPRLDLVYGSRSGITMRLGPALSSIDLRCAVRRAGLPNPERWTVHGLRASFICLELAHSGSLAHAMARARHRSIKSIQQYARELRQLDPPEPAWSLGTGETSAPELLP